MSTKAPTQPTLDHLPKKKPFNKKKKKPFAESQHPEVKTTSDSEDHDGSVTTDFTECLQAEITAVRKRKSPPEEGFVIVDPKETEKFLKKAKISFLGQNVQAKLKVRSPSSRVHIASQKLSVFRNKTGKEVQYTFCKKAQDTTTAQLTTSTGFKIGVLAFLGGGLGGQGGIGVGAEYSRGKETMEQSSTESGREMHAQVDVPGGGTVNIFETDYSTVYDTECDFDIAIEDSHQIEYYVGSKSGNPETCTAGDFKRDDDPDDSVTTKETWSKRVKDKIKKLVKIPVVHAHLRRTCKCKLESIEHDLEMELHKIKEASEDKPSEDEGGDNSTPDTGNVDTEK